MMSCFQAAFTDNMGLAAWRFADWVPRQWEQCRTEVTHSLVRHKAAGGILPIWVVSFDGMTGRYRGGVTWRNGGTGGDGMKCRRDMQVACK